MQDREPIVQLANLEQFFASKNMTEYTESFRRVSSLMSITDPNTNRQLGLLFEDFKFSDTDPRSVFVKKLADLLKPDIMKNNQIHLNRERTRSLIDVSDNNRVLMYFLCSHAMLHEHINSDHHDWTWISRVALKMGGLMFGVKKTPDDYRALAGVRCVQALIRFQTLALQGNLPTLVQKKSPSYKEFMTAHARPIFMFVLWASLAVLLLALILTNPVSATIMGLNTGNLIALCTLSIIFSTVAAMTLDMLVKTQMPIVLVLRPPASSYDSRLFNAAPRQENETTVENYEEQFSMSL